MFGPGMAPIKS